MFTLCRSLRICDKNLLTFSVGFTLIQRKITIQTDASGVGLGGVLLQNASQSVIFVSHALTEVEKRYFTIEHEFLAIVFTLNRLKTYLLCFH